MNKYQKLINFKKQLTFLWLFFVSVLFLNAQPQSFLISPRQTIENGTIARIYCLEFSKQVLRISNLAELTRFTGTVNVLHRNGTVTETTFQELYRSGKKIEIIPFNSHEHMQINFLDESIARITIGNEGIGLFRERMNEYESELARRNIEKILDLEAKGRLHSEIQDIIWRTRVLIDIVDNVHKRRIIDFQTTEREENKIRSTFSNSPTVTFEKNNQMFLRIDGLLRNSGNVNEYITELITHYHNDHINRSVVEQAIQERNFARLVGPNLARDNSKNETYSILSEHNSNIENMILDIVLNEQPLILRYISIGDFIYSAFRLNNDIRVEMFKYQSPRDTNADGIIYQITHKNVKQLFFGDIDDIRAIENLLDASAVNEQQYIIIKEEISNLIKQKQEVINGINNETSIRELNNRIRLLQDKQNKLPFLKADIVKWMHHAHVFNDERTDDVIRKLNEVVDPQYIIWQRYNNQNEGQRNSFYSSISRIDWM